MESLDGVWKVVLCSVLILMLILTGLNAPFLVKSAAGQLTPARDLTGVWTGSAEWTDTFDYYPAAVTCYFVSDFELDLNQNGNVLTGNVQYQNIILQKSNNDQACLIGLKAPVGPIGDGVVSSSSFSGSVSEGALEGSFTTDLMSGTIKGTGGIGTFNLSFKAQRQSVPTSPPSIPPTTPPSPALANTLVLKPGETSNRVLSQTASSQDPNIVMQFWADATGSAASWAQPQHLDLGTLYNGQTGKASYTITVPQDQQPENYELIWKVGCTASSGPCNPTDLVIPINVTAPPQPAPTPQAAPSLPQQTIDVSITDGDAADQSCVDASNCYDPSSVQISQGDTVTWTNDDSASHTVTSGNPSDTQVGKIFDSGIISAGSDFSFTFQNVGTYNYFCTLHPWMAGIVSVANQFQPQSSTNPIPTPQPVTEYKSYQNTEFGFSLKYPSGWQYQESPSQNGNFISIASFSPDAGLDPIVTVYYVKNDPYGGLEGQEYLDKMGEGMKDNCAEASFDTAGFTCSNFKLYTSNVNKYKDGFVYSVVSSLTQNFKDGRAQNLVTAFSSIPDHDGKWLLYLGSTPAKFDPHREEISKILDSFEINDFQPPFTSTGIVSTTPQDITNIDEAKTKKTIVAEINVVNQTVQTTSIDNNISVQTNNTLADSLSINISASSQTAPKVFLINLGATTINVANLKYLGIMYDGQLIAPATDVNSLLHAKSTDDPRYVIIITQSRAQILILVPHFSTHTITITNMSKVISPVPEFPLSVIAVFASIIAITVAITRKRIALRY